MSIQDRDYYREKRHSENDVCNKKSATSNLSNLSWKDFLRIILLWILIALFFFTIFDHLKPLQQVQTVENQSTIKNIPRNCVPLPPSGSSYMFDPSMNRTDALYSGLQIQNNHDHPMVAILTDPMSSKRLSALSIAPSQTTQTALPTGHYGMHVLLGSNWCNIETGFSDGANVTVAGGISVKAGSTTLMQFSGSGINPVQLALAYSLAKPVDSQNEIQSSEVIGVGGIDLQQTRDGHYFSSGTVNGIPVVFMIDTGATTVSVSTEIASRAGIQKCTPQKMATANGKVNACKAVVPEVTFGKFRMHNVEVIVMPNMPANALLGMNVLRNFRIEQIDQIMRISSR
ncbi:MAG: retroviral-like aspartic protease family protein [Betaproteobacteria bacterium]|nr:retroviral-like aspartic protease family protein [Betaproteobacteria bacterium]